MKQLTMVFALMLLAAVSAGCNAADQGSLKVETSWGKVKQVHWPGDFFTCWSPGCAVYDVDMRPWSDEIEVHTATKDNAPLKLKVRITARTKQDKIEPYLSTYGFDVKERHERRGQIESGMIQTAVRDAVVQHEAYKVFSEQDAIQNSIIEKVKPQLEQQIFADLIAVQIVERPIFDNSNIELAASNVVAAQKQKEAQEQYKQAAQIELEKNQIINQIYTQSPQAFELKKLEWQKFIAEAWASHQGPLVFGGSSVQVQVPANK